MKITNPTFNGGNQQFADTITNDKNITTNITGSTVHGSVATGKIKNSFNTSAKTDKTENDDAEFKRLKVITANKGFIFAVLVFITIVLLSVGYYAVEKGLFTHKDVEKLLNKPDDNAPKSQAK